MWMIKTEAETEACFIFVCEAYLKVLNVVRLFVSQLVAMLKTKE